MQTNENTYLIDPASQVKDQEQERKVLETFNTSFKIEEYTDEIAQLLNDYPNLRETMDKLGKDIYKQACRKMYLT